MLRKHPALLLFFLAPLLGEVISGSTPPIIVLANPFYAALLVVLYGGGALLTRELVIRWRRSWTSVVILGLAYALVEEALVLKAVFDPSWPGAGALGTYGRADGVGWVWLIQVVVFHAIVSITLPIMFAGLIVRDRRGEPWLSTRRLWALGAGWSLAIVVAAAILRPVEPPGGQYALLTATTALLVVLAKLRPARGDPLATGAGTRTSRPWLFGAIGAIAVWSFFIATWSGPDTGRPPELTVALQLVVLIVSTIALRRAADAGPLSDGEQLALGAGILSFFLLAGLPALLTGQTFLNVTALAVFGYAALRLRRRSATDQGAR